MLGGISGFFFGLFAGLDFWLFGVVALDSVLLVVLPVLGLAGGILLGLFPLFGREQKIGRPDVVPPEAAAEAVASGPPSTARSESPPVGGPPATPPPPTAPPPDTPPSEDEPPG